MTKYMKTRRHMCVWCPHDLMSQTEAQSLRRTFQIVELYIIVMYLSLE